MSTRPGIPRVLSVLVVLPALAVLGCEPEAPPRPDNPPKAPAPAAAPDKAPRAAPAPAQAEAAPAAKDVKKPVPIGKNVFFERLEGGRRRVLLNATVCFREGPLEQLLCKKRTKEHEAILSADLKSARDLHTALLLTGAEPGSPVRYEQKGDRVAVVPPKGTRIKVSVRYEDKGKEVTVPAQKWVRNGQTKKELEVDWVFAGSVLVPDPDDKDKPPFYAADSGDVICVSNFEGALLDLPINSSKNDSERSFEAFTERIPPLDTKVTVILEPELKKK
jgi:hypothetical protein